MTIPTPNVWTTYTDEHRYAVYLSDLDGSDSVLIASCNTEADADYWRATVRDIVQSHIDHARLDERQRIAAAIATVDAAMASALGGSK